MGRSVLRVAGWFLVGLLTAFNIMAMISSLFPLLVISIPVTVLVARWLDSGGEAGEARWAIAAGIAAAPLWLAWNNRHGPGTYCHAIGTPQYPGTECADQWDPRPFALAALALLGAAVVGPVVDRCRRRHASVRPSA